MGNLRLSKKLILFLLQIKNDTHLDNDGLKNMFEGMFQALKIRFDIHHEPGNVLYSKIFKIETKKILKIKENSNLSAIQKEEEISEIYCSLTKDYFSWMRIDEEKIDGLISQIKMKFPEVLPVLAQFSCIRDKWEHWTVQRVILCDMVDFAMTGGRYIVSKKREIYNPLLNIFPRENRETIHKKIIELFMERVF